MRVDIAWWDLNSEDPSLDELKALVSSQVNEIWQALDCLVSKYWLYSENPPRWGAVCHWSPSKPDFSLLPENISASLIGRPPDSRASFNLLHHTQGGAAEVTPLQKWARSRT